MNRVGCSSPPYGTPCFERTFRPHCPSTSTIALLLHRYHLVQLYIFPLMPYRRRFTRSPSFHTLSDALCRSMKTYNVTFLAWKTSSITCDRWVVWSSVPLYCLKTSLLVSNIVLWLYVHLHSLVVLTHHQLITTTSQAYWTKTQDIWPYISFL